MTPELWVVLLAGAVPGLIGLAGAVVAIVFATGERKARIAGEKADTKKTHAEINAMTSGEWKRLYDEMCNRIEKLEAKFKVYQSYIQYLWMVVVKLTNQLEDAGIDPAIKPDRQFRGDDDFAEIEWEWLDE